MTKITKVPMLAFRLGLGLVLTVVVMSSFTKSSSKIGAADDSYIFVRVSGLPSSTNPSDYEYQPTATCNLNDESTCKASWLEATAPTTAGQHPSGTFQSIAQFGDAEL